MTFSLTQLGLLALAALVSLLAGFWSGKRLHARDQQAWRQQQSLLEQNCAQLQDERFASLDRCEHLQQRLEQAQAQQAEREVLAASLQERMQATQARNEELRQQAQHLAEQLSELRVQHQKTLEQLTQASTAREQEQQASQEKLQLLQDNKEQLRQEFQNLASQIFDNKQQHFAEHSRQSLDALLQPLKEQLASFRLRVDQVHSDTVQGQSAMKTELGKLMELNARITTEAANLTRALKGDKKLQGAWGEQKVELLLEHAGLRKGIEFERESNFKDEQARDRRPDFIVHLPEGKHIIIDSKVSLVAYTEYVAADNELERNRALQAHLQALRNHIDGLSGKQYPQLNGMQSPDFVFLFMAVEPAYLLAAEQQPGLFQAAFEKQIAVVTATTLLPVLRVVANLWSIQRQNQSTKVLAEQAARIHEKLRVFVTRMEKLGSQIDSLQGHYQETFKTLHEGRGSLTKLVDGFSELGVKTLQRLPASVTHGDEQDSEADPS